MFKYCYLNTTFATLKSFVNTMNKGFLWYVSQKKYLNILYEQAFLFANFRIIIKL